MGQRQNGCVLNSQDRARCRIHEVDILDQIGGQVEAFESGSEKHDFLITGL